MAATRRLAAVMICATALPSLVTGLDSTAVLSSALTCSGVETCVQVSAAQSEADIEQEEALEIRAMEVRLLQSAKQHLSLHSARTTSQQTPRPSESHAQGSASSVASRPEPAGEKNASSATVHVDHNGKLCLLCAKPKLERIGDQVYKEFRTDCGSLSGQQGPAKEQLSKPVASMLQRGGNGQRATNGYCELNFAKSCVDAVANRDYLYWAKSLDFDTEPMRKTAKFDARYCHLNGFLERDILALQHNFTGLQAKANELCETKYAKYGIEKLTFIDMMAAARYNDTSAPTLSEAEFLAAWNCAMGDLGCDIAGCAYSFCHKGSDTYGIYGECQGWDPISGMPHAVAAVEAATK